MAEPSSFSKWADARRTLDKCPWAGPVPLEAEPDREVPFPLVGRKDDRTKFLRGVLGHTLTILSGSSGVGKSSLVNMGIAPDLARAGFRSVICRDWVDRRARDANEGFLTSKVAEAIQKIPELAAKTEAIEVGPSYFDELGRRFGRELVIVLDQFEELIRYAPSQARTTISELLDINARLDIRVVVSLRSEHLHELRPLEKGARPFTIFNHALQPVVDDDAIERLILAPNRDGEVITEDAAALLKACWKAAMESTDDAAADIGLLHIHALLYTLWFRAGGRITTETIEAFRDEMERRERGRRAAAGWRPVVGQRLGWPIFLQALGAAIEVKLDHCERAARDVGLDSYLIAGTKRALAQTVQHLSSAGYKIPRAIGALATTALKQEFDVLLNAAGASGSGPSVAGGRNEGAPDGSLDERQIGHLVKVLIDAFDGQDLDLCRASRLDIARAADQEAVGGEPTNVGPLEQGGTSLNLVPLRSWVERLHPGMPPWVANGRGATCGPLMGMAPANALIEEVRRFAFALAWLNEARLVRFTSPGRTGRMISLIHDGFGRALSRWSIEPLASIGAALSALTAPSGAVFEWPTADGDFHSEFDGAEGVKVIPNLRWRGAWVEARFRNVVFANCDFRGSYFSWCTFDGVVFMNCLLDGAIFSDCTITGTMNDGDPAEEPWDSASEPTFLVPQADEVLIREIAHYQGCADRGKLFSPKAGLAASPDFDQEDATAADPWQLEADGLVVYGGRVSSLVFRNCSDGPIALRHVAGSGLEIVEQSAGALEITGSVLRHLSISTEVGVPIVGGMDDSPGEFRIRISGSVVAQMWLGDDLSGSLVATDSQLIQVFNPSQLEASVIATTGDTEPSLVYQLVGFGAIDADEVDEVWSGPRSWGAMARTARQMDYRRDPALAEAREQATEDRSQTDLDPGSTSED